MKRSEVRTYIKKHRKLLGLRQGALAKLTGIHRTRLSAFENNRLRLNDAELEKIWTVFQRLVLERSEAQKLPWPKLADGASEHGRVTRKMRTMYGITQKELASGAGIGQDVISLYENGYVELEGDQLNRIEEYLERLIEQRKVKSVPLSSLLRPSVEVSVDAKPTQPILKGFDDPQYASGTARDLIQQLKDSQKKLKESDAFVRTQDALIESQNELITIERRLIDELLARIAQLEAEDQVTKEQLKSLREWLNAEQIAALAHDDAEKKREQVHQIAGNAISEEQK